MSRVHFWLPIFLLQACSTYAPESQPPGRSELPPIPALSAPPAPWPEPAGMIGMSENEMTQQLGRPTDVITQDEQRVLDYRTPVCTLSLFMHRGGSPVTWRVLRVIASEGRGKVVAPLPCLAAVTQGHSE